MPYISSMHVALTGIPNHVPQEISERIVFLQLLDIHNQVNTIKEARDYLCSVSLVNKECNKYANDPIITRAIMHNVSHITNLCNGIRKTIATVLATPGAKNYIDQSKKLITNKELPITEIETLVQYGADVNFSWNYGTAGKVTPLSMWIQREQHVLMLYLRVPLLMKPLLYSLKQQKKAPIMYN